MIYTIFVLTFGVFIGQEYPLLPSIKLLAISCYDYLNTFKKEPDNNNNYHNSWFKYWFKRE
jgi:hypothetical protein